MTGTADLAYITVAGKCESVRLYTAESVPAVSVQRNIPHFPGDLARQSMFMHQSENRTGSVRDAPVAGLTPCPPTHLKKKKRRRKRRRRRRRRRRRSRRGKKKEEKKKKKKEIRTRTRRAKRRRRSRKERKNKNKPEQLCQVVKSCIKFRLALVS